MPRPVLVLNLLLVSTVAVSSAHDLLQAHAPAGGTGQANTWIATTSSGRTLSGTWTAAADPKTGHVTGTWTLIGTNRKTVAHGGWSAAKSAAGWTGTWRAIVSGRGTEYSGTWTATAELAANASLSSLFEKAAETIVSGRWRAGGQSGAWSIRAFN